MYISYNIISCFYRSAVTVLSTHLTNTYVVTTTFMPFKKIKYTTHVVELNLIIPNKNLVVILKSLYCADLSIGLVNGKKELPRS